MQFGRVLACHLLNAKEKLNWKNCVLGRDEEEKLALKYKEELSKIRSASKKA